MATIQKNQKTAHAIAAENSWRQGLSPEKVVFIEAFRGSSSVKQRSNRPVYEVTAKPAAYLQHEDVLDLIACRRR